MLYKSVCVCFLMYGSVIAQVNNSGIYSTVDDFVKEKLTLEIDCKTEKHKIKLHDFFEKPYIDVVHRGQKIRYNKNEIFGYKTCDNENYRFYNNEHYLILAKDRINLYSQMSSKTILGEKGMYDITEYFFSSSLSTALVPLTILNLKKGYPKNHKFHDLIDAEFKNDEELVLYDSFHKKYKIMHLFEESMKMNK